MDRSILGTSTILKSIFFKPSKSLPSEIYRRELEIQIHKKCRVLIKGNKGRCFHSKS